MKYRITFLLSRKAADTTGRLKCRVSLLPGSVRTEFNVGYVIEVSGWNVDTMRCKRGSMHGRHHAQKINAEIDAMETRLANILDNADKITPDELHRAYKGQKTEGEKTRFLDLIVTFMETERPRWAQGTCKKFTTMYRHVEAYEPECQLEDVSSEWLQNYIKSLTTLNHSSINKEIKSVRWVLRWAREHGYKIDDSGAEYYPRLKTTPRKVIYLTWDELMSIYTHEFSNRHLQEVRDVFCFCCFTGLRFSDVKSLRRANVYEDHISVTTLKTGDLIDIPLSSQAKTILDRYRDADLKGYALPVANNAEVNETLKEIAEACELNDEVMMTEYRDNRRVDTVYKKYELITTHCGRRTFVCNALMMGIAAEVVMSITGHSSYEAMKPYIAIADDAKRHAIDIFSRMGDTKSDTK